MDSNFLINNYKKIFAGILALVLIAIVMVSGPATAFYITADPSISHGTGTKDANVTVTIYKERYEALGDIYARMIGMDTDGTNSGLKGDATYDANCWANDDYYSYLDGAYLYNLQSRGDLNVYKYGYVENQPGQAIGNADLNVAARFQTAASSDLNAQTYYGYGYNYAGTFDCTFRFKSLPDGIYVSALVFINGIPVSKTGYDAGQSGVTADVNTIFAIKSFASSGNTDVNFVDPNGNKKLEITIPAGSATASRTINANDDFITIDINIVSTTSPSGKTIYDAPRFALDSNLGALTFSSTAPAVMKFYYSGIVSDDRASSFTNIYRYSAGDWTKISSGKSVDTTNDILSVNLSSFSEYGLGEDEAAAGGGTTTTTGGGGGGGGGTEEGTTGEEVKTIISKTVDVKITEEELRDILTRAGASETALQKAIEALEKTSVTKTIEVQKVTDAEGNVSYRTVITITVENKTGKILQNVKVLEEIPKSVIASLEEEGIESDFDFTVIEADPIVEFNIPKINNGQSIALTYNIGKQLRADQVEEFGKAVITAFEEVEIPTTPTGGAVTPTEEGADFTLLIVIVIIVVVVIGLAAYQQKKKEK